MNKNKHLLLWSSAVCLLLLFLAAARDTVFRDWRRTQAGIRTDTGPVKVCLRQIVVPGLRVTDRCVSCHLGMAPGEAGVTGPRVAAVHPRVPHDSADFGCTVCHGGQGAATERQAAHGDVPFWPEPMLPADYVYAGCGTCHIPVGVPNQAALARGRNAFQRLDCYACHRLDGRGGSLRVGGVGGMEGPDLSGVGAAEHVTDWYAQHLATSRNPADTLWTSTFRAISESERADLALFLGTCVGAPDLVEAKALFHSLGCRGCHKVNGVGGDDGVDLTHIGEKDPGRLNFVHVPGAPTLANWFAEHFRDPAKVVPGSAMPMLGLSEAQIHALTVYTLSLRPRSFPGAYWPRDRVRVEHLGEREFAGDGATIFGVFCAACHGADGAGRRYPGMPVFPAVGNPAFLALTPDAFLAATISQGRPGTLMSAWGSREGRLRPEEIQALIQHLRAAGGGAAPAVELRAPRWVTADAALGERLFAAHCSGCHGAAGKGGEAPALNNQVLLSAATDTYLVQTINRGRRGTVMVGFAEASTAHPALAPADIEAVVRYLRTWEKAQR